MDADRRDVAAGPGGGGGRAGGVGDRRRGRLRRAGPRLALRRDARQGRVPERSRARGARRAGGHGATGGRARRCSPRRRGRSSPSPRWRPRPGRRTHASRRNLGRRRPAGAGDGGAGGDARGAGRERRGVRRRSLPAAPSPVEDAQGIGIPLGLAELAEGYLKAHRESALTPYLYAYLMVQYRLAFERADLGEGARGPEGLGQEVPHLPPPGPGVDGSAGQGGRRRHRRPALPPAPDRRASRGTSTPTPAAATSDAPGACSEQLCRNCVIVSA